MSSKYISWGQVKKAEREKEERERLQRQSVTNSSPVESSAPADSSSLLESGTPADSSSPLKSVAPIESVPPVDSGREVKSSGPVKSAQAKSVGPVNERPAARSTTGPTESGGPVKLGALRVERNYSRVLNSVLDTVLPTLPPAAALAYVQLYRLSYGNGRDWCKIGSPRLAERCALGESTLRRAIRQLEQRGLVRIVQYAFGGSEQGIVFQLVPPPGTPEGAVSSADSSGPVKSSGPPRSSGPVESGPMKDMKEQERKGEGKSEPSIYEIRTIAARLYEVHRGDASYDRDRLRAAVREALIGQGLGASDEQLDEAIRGMAH